MFAWYLIDKFRYETLIDSMVMKVVEIHESLYSSVKNLHCLLMLNL